MGRARAGLGWVKGTREKRGRVINAEKGAADKRYEDF